MTDTMHHPQEHQHRQKTSHQRLSGLIPKQEREKSLQKAETALHCHTHRHACEESIGRRKKNKSLQRKAKKRIEEKQTAKKSVKKTKKKRREESDSEEEEDVCSVCLESFSKSREVWLQSWMSKSWAHKDCTPGADVMSRLWLWMTEFPFFLILSVSQQKCSGFYRIVQELVELFTRQ